MTTLVDMSSRPIHKSSAIETCISPMTTAFAGNMWTRQIWPAGMEVSALFVHLPLDELW